MRPSLFLELVLVLALGFLGVIYVRADASRDIVPTLSTTNQYIVSFHDYHDVDRHETILAGILGSQSNGAWQHVPRKNLATKAFPSDFALVFLGRLESQAKKLLAHHIVKRVSAEQKYSGKPAAPQHKNRRAQFGRASLGLSWSRSVRDGATAGAFRQTSRRPETYSFNKFRAPPFPFATDPWDGKRGALHDSGSNQRRTLKFGWGDSKENLFKAHKDFAGDITGAFHASKIWKAGFKGKGIRVAVFDTGVKKNHPHFEDVEERTNWTDEPSLGDGLGHGSFVAGIIASSKECLGFAPEASIFTYRVFTDGQVSFTSWFLEAINYAIFRDMDILNLSIGGPDHLDIPFYEKVRELAAHQVVVVSAIGNDGPLWGTLNSPADQPSVLGVGGVDNYFDMASFASRGMTTWELPEGYGRVKPDVVSFAAGLRGSAINGGCRRLGGTSVASPVIAGAVTLLASVFPKEKRKALINPATIKQIIVESAVPIKVEGKHTASIYEQGAGLLNLEGAFELAKKASPRPSLHPSKMDMTDCNYMWPFCQQDVYAHAIPTIFNFTLLNGMGVVGKVTESKFTPTTNGEHLNVKITHSDVVWPWVGHVAVHMTVPASSSKWSGIVEGTLSVVVESPPPIGSPEGTDPLQKTATALLKVRVQPTPLRSKRILWDQFHNVRYPAGFFPRDNLDDNDEQLDWHGDHPHTNFHGLYDTLRGAGYYLEVLGKDFTCFDAENYGTLLIVDAEEEYFPEELKKLETDVKRHGLNIIVFADWYNEDVLKKVRFFDENTREFWTASTGGANIPAINDLLRPYNIAFGNRVLKGDFADSHGKRKVRFVSGNAISIFPKTGKTFKKSMADYGSSFLNRGSHNVDVHIMGITQVLPKAADGESSNAGRIAVYGDSNCLDSNHMRGGDCYWLLKSMLSYTMENQVDDTLAAMLQSVSELESSAPSSQIDIFMDKNAGPVPKRMPDSEVQMKKHSKVLGGGKRPKCLKGNGQ